MRRLRNVAIAAVVLAACSSSSSNSDLSEPDSGTGGDATLPDTGAHDSGGFDSGGFDSGLGDTQIGDVTAPPDVKSQCVFTGGDAGEGGTADAGDAGEGGTAGIGSEQEPNDDANSANTLLLNGVECGQITPGTDVDFFKFTLPASATSMQITFDGYVSLKFTPGTDPPVTITPNSFPSVPTKPGADYLVEVHSFDGQPQTYAIIVSYK